MPLAYVVLSILGAFFLTKHCSKRIAAFVVAAWILVQPVAHHFFILDLPGLPFDLQPTRILLIICGVLSGYYLFLRKPLKSERRLSIMQSGFALLLLLYVLLVAVSVAWNWHSLTASNGIAIITGPLTAVLLFYVVNRAWCEKFETAIFRTIVSMGCASALVAFIQIGINPDFLKSCPPRIAFGSVIRSSGLFNSEYDFAYFQILALVIVAETFRPSKLKTSLALILILSVACTFHRMATIAFFVVSAVYLMKYASPSRMAFVLTLMLATICIALPLFFAIEGLRSSDFAKDRLFQDTATGRIDQYIKIAREIPRNLLGVADATSEKFFQISKKNDLLQSYEYAEGQWAVRPYRVHNGYLEAGINFGPFGLCLFTFLLLAPMINFWTSIQCAGRIALMTSLTLLIANLTNGISTLSLYLPLLLSLLVSAALRREQMARESSDPHCRVAARPFSNIIP